MEIRLSKQSDTDKIMELIQGAKDKLKAEGLKQWQSGYPDRPSIEDDIKSGSGYSVIDENKLICYGCISFDGEESYNAIDGSWKSIQPYAVIHRVAVSREYGGRGLASLLLKYAEELCAVKNVHSIKIDTDKENSSMLHVLQKNGYEFCGIIQYDDGPKMAFEKLL